MAAVVAPSAASASAYGIQYWGAFTVNIGGQNIGIPSGQLAHKVNGSGTRIDSEWAHITTGPGFCKGPSQNKLQGFGVEPWMLGVARFRSRYR